MAEAVAGWWPTSVGAGRPRHWSRHGFAVRRRRPPALAGGRPRGPRPGRRPPRRGRPRCRLARCRRRPRPGRGSHSGRARRPPRGAGPRPQLLESSSPSRRVVPPSGRPGARLAHRGGRARLPPAARRADPGPRPRDGQAPPPAARRPRRRRRAGGGSPRSTRRSGGSGPTVPTRSRPRRPWRRHPAGPVEPDGHRRTCRRAQPPPRPRAPPDLARTLVASTWSSDPARVRTDVLRALTVGLAPDDEPLLEAALDDRAGGVRDVATELLDRLPGSARAGRMGARLASLLSTSGARAEVREDRRPRRPRRGRGPRRAAAHPPRACLAAATTARSSSPAPRSPRGRRRPGCGPTSSSVRCPTTRPASCCTPPCCTRARVAPAGSGGVRRGALGGARAVAP